MKIEAGKYYKTRDGKKAFVEHVFQKSPFSGSSPPGYTSFGFIEGNGQVEWWTADGFYVTRGQGCNDLVAEWVDPITVNLTARLIDRNGLKLVLLEPLTTNAVHGIAIGPKMNGDTCLGFSQVKIVETPL
jgi:hypothetical protein